MVDYLVVLEHDQVVSRVLWLRLAVVVIPYLILVVVVVVLDLLAEVVVLYLMMVVVVLWMEVVVNLILLVVVNLILLVVGQEGAYFSEGDLLVVLVEDLLIVKFVGVTDLKFEKVHCF